MLGPTDNVGLKLKILAEISGVIRVGAKPQNLLKRRVLFVVTEDCISFLINCFGHIFENVGHDVAVATRTNTGGTLFQIRHQLFPSLK